MKGQVSMKKIKLLALFGESSVGKDSIQHWLVSKLNNTHGMVSYTSRPPRDYEVDGREYHFVSQEEFEKLIIAKKMLEHTCFNNWYYGTYIDELQPKKINVGVFNPQGIRGLLTHSDTIDILPVWIQTHDKDRLLRSLQRENNPNCEEICRRFLADKKDFSNIDFEHEIYLNNDSTYNYYEFLNKPKVLKFIEGQI